MYIAEAFAFHGAISPCVFQGGVVPLPAVVSVYFSQASFLCEAERFLDPRWNVKWPYLEDLLSNSSLSLFFHTFSQHKEIPPHYVEYYNKGWCHIASGRQGGALSSKAAIPPIVEGQGCPFEHFYQARKLVFDRDVGTSVAFVDYDAE